MATKKGAKPATKPAAKKAPAKKPAAKKPAPKTKAAAKPVPVKKAAVKAETKKPAAKAAKPVAKAKAAQEGDGQEARSEEGVAGIRQVHPLAGRDNLARRADNRFVKETLPTGTACTFSRNFARRRVAGNLV